jgi:hypothetical protein
VAHEPAGHLQQPVAQGRRFGLGQGGRIGAAEQSQPGQQVDGDGDGVAPGEVDRPRRRGQVPEARSTDLHSVAKRHVTVAPDADVIAAQTADLSDELAAPIRAPIAELAAKQSLEARCAKDADKLECLLQAREHQARGNQLVQPWVDTMLSAMQTESGKRLAEAAVKTPVDAWWHDIVASYGR